MKKQLITLMALFVITITSAVAQDGQPQRQTAEERTKSTMEKLSPLILGANELIKTEAVFLDFYKTQQKAMEDLRASGSFDREAMMAKRDEMAKQRNEKLKALFTAEQFKKWSEEVEPSLRPQRRN
ncbi:MAG: hypothetical protein ABIO05_02400 [Ferruginibacter sp.]